jgi:hypothetical protein
LVSKGVETTLNALGPKTAPLLTATTLASLDWPERKAGIQLLTSAEVADLGPLNDAERRTLRRVVNTKDVYPYAVIVEDDPDHVIYLWKPEAIDSKTNMAQAQEWPLPDGIPTLAAYLEQFKPILQDAAAAARPPPPRCLATRSGHSSVGSRARPGHSLGPTERGNKRSGPDIDRFDDAGRLDRSVDSDLVI